METALGRRFPGVAARAPRVRFTTLPTPVERLARLGAEVGHPDMWVKRDDRSAILYGGNKPRKLEFLLGDALARGRHAVLTTGGTGTNHGLATSIFARHVGLRSILVLLDQPLTEHVRRSLLLDFAAGAELYYAKSVAGVAARAARALAAGTLHGSRPYLIATGGTSAVGNLGYVDAAFELAEQIRAGELPEPATVYVAAGTAGTAAGLSLGFALAGLRSRVVAVSVSDLMPPTSGKIAGLARRCLRHLRSLDEAVPAISIEPDRVRVEEGFVGPGYGSPTAEGKRVIALIRDSEGLGLETTYTGKCLAALLGDIERGALRNEPVLFWNTYSSVDPAGHLGPLPDFRALPAALHPLFTGPLPELA
jgi:D-cysteine desulfhydrase